MRRVFSILLATASLLSLLLVGDVSIAGATAREEFMSGPPYNGQLLTPAEVTSATQQAHWFSGKTIVDQLESHDLSWKAYMQSAPTVNFTGMVSHSLVVMHHLW